MYPHTARPQQPHHRQYLLHHRLSRPASQTQAKEGRLWREQSRYHPRADTQQQITITNGNSKTESTSSYGAAKPYRDIKGSLDTNAPNCYAYAIGSDVNEQPGQRSGRSPRDTDVKDFANAVIADLKTMGRSARIISGPNATIQNDEYRIALRVGTKPIPEFELLGIIQYDYHFMVQTDSGQWAEKHGIGGDSILHEVGLTPDSIPWTFMDNPYYDSEIIYLAISE